MRCARWILSALALSGIFAGGASAGWWDRVRLDAHRMNSYPSPFQDVDRELARAPFGVMVEKGWQRQTTVGDEHFDPDTQQLTRAGEIKVRWILTQAPESRRQVYVLRSANDEATATRIDSVQVAVSRILREGPLPAILATDVPSAGWPADYVNEVDKKIQATIPPPRLPAASASSGGGS